MSDEQLAQPGDTYASMIQYVVPATLDVLTGPRTGVLELPKHIDWSPDNRYDLSLRDDAITFYSKVISEAASVEDLTNLINRDLLLTLWPSLRLPRRCAGLWTRAFPELGHR